MLSSWQGFPDFLFTSVAQASQPDLLRQVFQIQSLTNCSGIPVETSFASTQQRVPEYLRDAISLLDKFRTLKTEAPGVSKIEGIEQPTEKDSTLIN
jgi:hypothetical protein